MIKVFSVCYSDRHFVNSSPGNQFSFENRKRNTFEVLEYLSYSSNFRRVMGNNITLQGNLDPTLLYAEEVSFTNTVPTKV